MLLKDASRTRPPSFAGKARPPQNRERKLSTMKINSCRKQPCSLLGFQMYCFYVENRLQYPWLDQPRAP